MNGLHEQPPPRFAIDRRHPLVRRVIARWRYLVSASGGAAPGEPTLIACSGGADSTALVLALASTGVNLALLFAEHDARSRDQVLRDRATVERLAAAIGADFTIADCTRSGGAVPGENEMREARYAALATEARAREIRFVATGHQADDQLETILLALIRGSGPAGMAGVPEHRLLDASEPPVHLLRPMLGLTRADCEAICTDAGLAPPGERGASWAVDETNSERRFLRNRVRHELVPMLKSFRPGIATRASRSAEWFRQMATLLERQAIVADKAARDPGATVWRRPRLREETPIVIGEVLRRAVAAEFDRQGLDRLGGEKIVALAEAIADSVTDPRVFEIGDGLEVSVRAHEIELRRIKPR